MRSSHGNSRSDRSFFRKRGVAKRCKIQFSYAGGEIVKMTGNNFSQVILGILMISKRTREVLEPLNPAQKSSRVGIAKRVYLS